jgi:hypothetical protein
LYNSAVKSFDSRLRGTWESNDPSKYSGSLKIEIDTITIYGYEYSQTQQNQQNINDNKRPFKDYPRDICLTGYSEDGKIFIEYGGAQNGITYTWTETGSYPNKYKLLEFDFGGRKEILQWPVDY